MEHCNQMIFKYLTSRPRTFSRQGTLKTFSLLPLSRSTFTILFEVATNKSSPLTANPSKASLIITSTSLSNFLGFLTSIVWDLMVAPVPMLQTPILPCFVAVTTLYPCPDLLCKILTSCRCSPGCNPNLNLACLVETSHMVTWSLH